MLDTLDDVNEFLREYYVSSGSPRVGTNYRLQDTVELAERVGSPHERLKVVHVAGTSGKTSTAYFMSSLIRESGMNVGLTVSPHMSSVTERVQINGKPINDISFIAYFREYVALATDNFTIQPSFFELMVVFALWVFDKQGVDYAVVETGMGGTFDSTNVCRRSDKLCIITDIGHDHTHILGSELEEIAGHKAGIIAEQNIVCMYRQDEPIMAAIDVAVAAHDAQIRFAPDTATKTYYERNFHLAKFAYEQLAVRDGLPALGDGQVMKARATHVPGRLEKIRVGRTTFLLDGAHNEQKMTSLLETLSALYPRQTWPMVVAMKADKDGPAVVQLLAKVAGEVVTSEFRHGQDLPSTPTKATELARLFQEFAVSARAIPSLSVALGLFIAENKKQTVLVTGSLYAIAEARTWLLSKKQGILEQ